MSKPAVRIAIASDLEPGCVAELESLVRNSGADFECRRYTPQPMNCFTWAFTAAVMVWFSKSYFDGFLKELGKRHATAFDDALKQTLAKLKQRTARIRTADEIRRVIAGEKPELVGVAGPMLSITLETNAEESRRAEQLEFIFLPEIGSDELDSCLGGFHRLLLREDSEESGAARAGGEHVMVYVPQRGWVSSEILVTEEIARKGAT